jgi:hypothetical protein
VDGRSGRQRQKWGGWGEERAGRGGEAGRVRQRGSGG